LTKLFFIHFGSNTDLILKLHRRLIHVRMSSKT